MYTIKDFEKAKEFLKNVDNMSYVELKEQNEQVGFRNKICEFYKLDDVKTLADLEKELDVIRKQTNEPDDKILIRFHSDYYRFYFEWEIPNENDLRNRLIFYYNSVIECYEKFDK